MFYVILNTRKYARKFQLLALYFAKKSAIRSSYNAFPSPPLSLPYPPTHIHSLIVAPSLSLSLSLLLPPPSSLSLFQIEALIAGEVAMEDSSGLPSDPAELQTVIEEAETQLASLQEKMAEETSKLERYKVSCTVKHPNKGRSRGL